MLYFSRWKTAAILGTALVVSLAALTNLLPASTFDNLPTWAQRKFHLGYDLQGGERVQLIVDENAVRKMWLDRLRDDMRRLLREQRIPNTGVQIRADGAEVWIREVADMPRAMMAFQDYAQPTAELPIAKPAPRIPADGWASLTSDRSAPVPPPQLDLTVADRLVRLTYTAAANVEHRRLGTRGSFEIIRRRLRDLNAPHEIYRVGDERIVIETTALGWRNIMY